MAKNKLKKFAQINSFPNVIQPEARFPVAPSPLKGEWNRNFFHNKSPIILEIGCGKGEYTLGLARNYPEKNFVGIDIKGDRIWHGANQALEEGLLNVAFLRIQAERINFFFDKDEVSQIWITFPDPYTRESRKKKRLSSPQFLNRYKNILRPNGTISLKTDNQTLYTYTLDIIEQHRHQLVYATDNLYGVDTVPPESHARDIQTYYEKIYMSQGIQIHYLVFQLRNHDI